MQAFRHELHDITKKKKKKLEKTLFDWLYCVDSVRIVNVHMSKRLCKYTQAIYR